MNDFFELFVCFVTVIVIGIGASYLIPVKSSSENSIIKSVEFLGYKTKCKYILSHSGFFVSDCNKYKIGESL